MCAVRFTGVSFSFNSPPVPIKAGVSRACLSRSPCAISGVMGRNFPLVSSCLGCSLKTGAIVSGVYGIVNTLLVSCLKKFSKFCRQITIALKHQSTNLFARNRDRIGPRLRTVLRGGGNGGNRPGRRNFVKVSGRLLFALNMRHPCGPEEKLCPDASIALARLWGFVSGRP